LFAVLCLGMYAYVCDLEGKRSVQSLGVMRPGPGRIQ